MLIALKMNNCFIYNSEVDFSMRADMRYKRFSSNVASFGDSNVLKTSIIIGPNNAGKTNLIRCINALKRIMLNSKTTSLSKHLFSENPVCSLSVAFLENDEEYVFEIKYDVSTREYIYERFAKIAYDRYRNKKEINIILRDNIIQEYYCEDADVIQAMNIAAKNNILIYLLDTEKFDVLKQMKQIITSFASKIDIVDMNNIDFRKTMRFLKEPSDMQKRIVDFIRNADVSLDDYKYLNDDEVKINLGNIENENSVPQEKVLRFSESIAEMLHLTSVYKGIPVPSLIYDSTGTKKIIAIASYVMDAITNGKILVVDELDNSLHFKLTRAIITLFNNELNEKAQLICTVHDVSLLDCKKLFRKEQIWFAYKDRDNAYLYSLSEFTSENDGIRDTSDIVQKYKSGVFGALPDPDLFQSLMEVHTNVNSADIIDET